MEVHVSGVISKATILITLITGLITALITTHERPSRDLKFRISSWLEAVMGVVELGRSSGFTHSLR